MERFRDLHWDIGHLVHKKEVRYVVLLESQIGVCKVSLGNIRW